MFLRVRARRVTSWWRRYACEWRHDAAIGRYDYYDYYQVTATTEDAEPQNEVVALLTRSRPTYELPLLLASLRRRKPPQVVRRVHSRSAFEERIGNTRFASARERYQRNRAKKSGI